MEQVTGLTTANISYQLDGIIIKLLSNYYQIITVVEVVIDVSEFGHGRAEAGASGAASEQRLFLNQNPLKIMIIIIINNY